MIGKRNSGPVGSYVRRLLYADVACSNRNSCKLLHCQVYGKWGGGVRVCVNAKQPPSLLTHVWGINKLSVAHVVESRIPPPSPKRCLLSLRKVYRD